jgi:hypothetical protein
VASAEVGSDAVWRALREKLKGAARRAVRVGILTNEMAEGDHAHITLAELAAVHEFGSELAGIPERSFIRSTLREEQPRAEALCLRLARGVIAERLEVDAALGLLGTWAVAAIQAKIRSNIPPELKQATIDRKHSSLALVDTGQLLNSITYGIVNE